MRPMQMTVGIVTLKYGCEDVAYGKLQSARSVDNVEVYSGYLP